MPLGSKTLEHMADFLVWYCKDKSQLKYRQLFKATKPDPRGRWTGVNENGILRRFTKEERDDFTQTTENIKIFGTVSQWAPSFSENNVYEFEYNGTKYRPTQRQCWVTSHDKMKLLGEQRRLFVEGDFPRYVIYHDDFPYAKITSPCDDTAPAQDKKYVVQTNLDVLQRYMLMTTDPGDLVLDITCGSGTTAYVAEQWGRRWITCDTSRVAITLSKQRLLTANFDYFQLAHPDEGVGSGFKYKTVPHITLKSIANNEPSPQETLYDQPFTDNKKSRVTSPFTVEAVPAPIAKSFDEVDGSGMQDADNYVSRSGETLRQDEWQKELFRTGVRAKGGTQIHFTRVETLCGTRFLQAEAETKEDNPKRVVV